MERRVHWAVAVVAVVASLALAWVHWLGLLVGGVALGLLADSWPRAVASGLGFGVLAWVVFLGVLWDASRLAAYWGTGQLLYVSLGIPMLLGLLGSLAFGLTADARTA